jgi:hypothetical protein
MINHTDAMATTTLRRLDAFLDEPDDLEALADAPFPTDAEARALLAEMGVDVTGLAEALRVQIDAVPAPAPPARARRLILAGAGLLAGVASMLVFVWWRSAEDPPIRALALIRAKAHVVEPADAEAGADAGR